MPVQNYLVQATLLWSRLYNMLEVCRLCQPFDEGDGMVVGGEGGLELGQEVLEDVYREGRS